MVLKYLSEFDHCFFFGFKFDETISRVKVNLFAIMKLLPPSKVFKVLRKTMKLETATLSTPAEDCMI